MDNKIINVIRMINAEYNSVVYSAYYRHGKEIYEIVNLIRKRKLIIVVKKIIELIRRKLVSKKYNDVAIGNDITDYKDESNYYSDYDITIYTCIVNGYDKPQEPIFPPNNYNYVLYTDDVRTVDSRSWKVRQIPDYLSKMSGNDINRYIKMHPSEFIDTRYALYVDGNVGTVTHIDDMIPFINPKIGIAMFKHPFRKCAYREAKACLKLKKGNRAGICNQVESYRKNGFPENYGLIEATIFLVDNGNDCSKELLDEWWNEYYKFKSGRDQIALPYLLWKKNMRIEDIATLGDDRRGDPRFRINLYHR